MYIASTAACDELAGAFDCEGYKFSILATP
jgi:hypothetical protein